MSSAILAAMLAVSDITIDNDFPAFTAFIENHRAGVGYATEAETNGRFAIFKENLAKAHERSVKCAGKCRHGVTKFSDLSADEFRAKHTGLKPTTAELKKRVPLKSHNVNASFKASSIDWRTKGAVTPIKNQGQCGSCWAFSATEQLESDYFLKYGTLKELSPQQICSCTTSCLGCNGGNPINAWQYVNTFGGQEPKMDYPYVSGITGATGTCKAQATEVTEDVSSVIGYMIADKPSMESNMLAQIAESPMSICVDAELWQTYESGIITASSGCGTTIDHAVQVVGYNAPGNYWIVRNSWGETWGEEGYVYVEYGHNVCGITDQATITVATQVEAKPVEQAK
jgi:cathepsin F